MNINELNIVRGTIDDIDELSSLYDELNDFYAKSEENYAGWIKGIYPTREVALGGVNREDLFLIRVHGRIAGTVILNNEEDEGHDSIKWDNPNLKKNEVMVIHTLAIHPDYFKMGIGSKLMQFAEDYGRRIGAKTIRLDTGTRNLPAIKLYEKFNYKFLGNVKLDYDIPGLEWFRCYEKVL